MAHMPHYVLTILVDCLRSNANGKPRRDPWCAEISMVGYSVFQNFCLRDNGRANSDNSKDTAKATGNSIFTFESHRLKPHSYNQTNSGSSFIGSPRSRAESSWVYCTHPFTLLQVSNICSHYPCLKHSLTANWRKKPKVATGQRRDS